MDQNNRNGRGRDNKNRSGRGMWSIVLWALLLTIPYGKTVTYSALAAQLAHDYGRSRPAPQAVGGAVGRNPVSLIVPCHRVVGASGSLTGYAGGLQRKQALLELEGVLARQSSLF